MTTRQELRQRWEMGLEANAGQSEEGSRFQWIRLVYLRIYRFLISRYGGGDWRVDSVDGTDVEGVELASSPMPFVDHTDNAIGLEPKSHELIRDKLAAIHDANEDRQTPGATQGLSGQDWVVVASSKRRQTADRIQNKLRAHGFQVRKMNRTTDYGIEVRYAEFAKALLALQEADPSPPATRYRITGRPLSRGSRLVSLTGLTIAGFCLCCWAALIVNDAIAHVPRQSLIMMSILFVCGVFWALLPAFRR
jgi:hypothetical protein